MGPLDAVSEVSRNFVSRATSPLVGAFITSWLVFNWRVVLTVLFSDLPIEAVIINIETNHLVGVRVLWLPLAFAVAFTLLAPWLNVVVAWLVGYAERERQRALHYRVVEVNKLKRTELMRDPSLRLPYESIEEALASAIVNMTEPEKRKFVTSIRATMEEKISGKGQKE
jgi:hypothetical protein